jgi:hypothetical protein
VHQSIRVRKKSLALGVRPQGLGQAHWLPGAARSVRGMSGRVPSTRVRESAAPSAGTAAGPGVRAGFARSFPPRQTPAGGRHSHRT